MMGSLQPPRPMRRFRLKFKSETQGSYDVTVIARSSADAIRNALTKVWLGPEPECLPFSISVSPEVRHVQR